MLKEELVKSASDDDERIIAQSKERNLLITNARLLGRPGLWSIVVDDSIIKRIESTDHFDPIIFPSEDYNVIDAACRIVIPGLVDAHVHLDKCYLLDQCCAKRGDFSEAMSETLLAKKGFSVEDVRNRARRLIEDEISFGTTLMRTHVEVDALVGFKSLEAIMQLKKEYENSITIQIAVFAQEGITNQPGQVDMMKEALKICCDAVGSAPYCDPNPEENIRIIFALAKEFNCPVDFHLDYHIDDRPSYLDFVIEETIKNGWQGKVLLGHMTHLSVYTDEDLYVIGERLKLAGIAVIALPASDICMMGREDNGNKRRGVCPVNKLYEEGVTAAFASNNIQNLFTFTGDGDILKIGTLLCQILQLTSENGANKCMEMATEIAAKALNVKHFLGENQSADLVILGDGILSSRSCFPCTTSNTTSISSKSYSTLPRSTSEKRSSSNQHAENTTSIYSGSTSFSSLPSSLKIFSAPPVDRIVIKKGRIVSQTTLHRTLYK